MPTLILGGPKVFLVFVAIAVLFHASIAITMGLNIFFWSFVATLPALLWASGQIAGLYGLA